MSKKETVEKIASSLMDYYYEMKVENETLKRHLDVNEAQNRHIIALLKCGITDHEIVKRLKIYFQIEK